MKYYEYLYLFSDNKKLIQDHLGDFLLYQIYSPALIRQVYLPWSTLPKYLRDNTPGEIVKLIEESPYLSNKFLKEKLNKYILSRAVQTLEQYQSCHVPFTQDPKVPQQRIKLTSRKGDQALLILQNALVNKQYTDKMADLALRTSHKFLFDSKYYINIPISKKMAETLTLPMCDKKGGRVVAYRFPAIQLTKGCQNHCSHCDSRAEPHLSHMPWPIFVTFHRGLNKYYRHLPQKMCDHYFSQFFADSDMLDYDEPVMRVDSGDVGLWIAEEKAYCQYLTRGVKNAKNKLALSKALVSGQPIAISFVDTPKENMQRNLEQLNETLDTVESVIDRRGNPSIVHLHLKSGPTIDKKVFRDFPLEQSVIHALGRAKEFPRDEVDHFPDDTVYAPCLIEPNGNITEQIIKNGDIIHKQYSNIYKKQWGPQINPVRLFLRRHFGRSK